MTLTIGVCLKAVDRRPEVNPLTGAVQEHHRSTGASEADRAALELGIQTAERWGGSVVAVSFGPAHADGVLAEALASGASRAIRIDASTETASDQVAAALATALGSCDLVWCGDYSLDRGSGSVPAYLASHLGAAQCLGLVSVDLLDDEPPAVIGVRRLDGGRRQRLLVRAPAVLSVEGAAARLRRASLAGLVSASRPEIEVVAGPPGAARGSHITRPFRPRARVLPAPAAPDARDRIVSLLHLTAATGTGQPVELEPGEAADRILSTLAAWGYLDQPANP